MKNTALIANRLISIHEAAEYTGLSVHTIYKMVSQRRIPYVKMGRRTKRGTLRRLEAVESIP